MNLNKENTNQIIKIVVIAIILLVALLNISSLWNGFKVFLNIISPFLWGLAIAFILNIFMTLYENKLFKIDDDSYVVIPRNVKLAESPSFGKPIMLYDVNSSGTKAYTNLARAIAG